MISLIELYSFTCLICFQTINLSSARLALNQKFSLDSAAISDAIQNRSTSPPTEELVLIGTLWGGATEYFLGLSVSFSYNGDTLASLNVTGGNYADSLGWSTSLSGDGKWLAVGTVNGYVKLVETETGKEITIDGYDRVFGRSVSVSHDGNRTAVAGYDFVRVFGKEKDRSIFQIGEDILTDDDLSTVVALSADGETLAIGEPSYDNLKGRVRVLEWNSGEWKQVGGDMVEEYYYDLFGWTLDFTADGHRVVIGTYKGNYVKYGGNYVEVYDYDGSEWEVVGGKLFGESDDQNRFGSSVSISDDGSVILIGSPYFKSDGFLERGRAAVYQFENGDWHQVGDDILGKNAGDYAGYSVAISGDGNTVSIGAPWADSDRGYVMMYELN